MGCYSSKELSLEQYCFLARKFKHYVLQIREKKLKSRDVVNPKMYLESTAYMRVKEMSVQLFALVTQTIATRMMGVLVKDLPQPQLQPQTQTH